jgi:hypothetical protein
MRIQYINSHTDYDLTNGRCFFNPKSQNGQCCLNFGNDGRCQQCAGGLQVSQSSGLCEDKKIEGCLKKSQEGCQICAKGTSVLILEYDLISGTCVSRIDRCSKYDSQFNCVACEGSSQLISGACLPQVQVKTISYCQKYNDFGCSQCQSGYLLTPNLLCKPSFPGCQQLDSQGGCQACQAPFYQLVNSTCAVVGCTSYSNGVCTCCDASVGFKLVNGQCLIDRCVYFSLGGCSQC